MRVECGRPDDSAGYATACLAMGLDLDCGAATPDRLNPGLAIGRQVSAAPVLDATTFDAAGPGSGNTLSLYQLGCGCADTIRVVKSTTADELVLH